MRSTGYARRMAQGRTYGTLNKPHTLTIGEAWGAYQGEAEGVGWLAGERS